MWGLVVEVVKPTWLQLHLVAALLDHTKRLMNTEGQWSLWPQWSNETWNVNKIVGSQLPCLETSYKIYTVSYCLTVGFWRWIKVIFAKGQCAGFLSEKGAKVFIACVVLSVVCGRSRDGIARLPLQGSSVVTYGKGLADAEPNHQDVNLFTSRASGHVTSLLNSFCITCCCRFLALQSTFLWLLFVGRNFPIICHHGCRKI